MNKTGEWNACFALQGQPSYCAQPDVARGTINWMLEKDRRRIAACGEYVAAQSARQTQAELASCPNPNGEEVQCTEVKLLD